METTSENREHLRKLINERIPQDGTEEDTRFTDDDLDELLEPADNIYQAASEGWMLKAGMYKSEMAEFHTVSSGTESYRLTELRDRLEYARTLSQYYSEKASQGGLYSDQMNAVFLSAERPEV